MSTRYPFQALLDLLHCDESTVKNRLGIDHRQVSRYQREGLTEKRADELADAAGYLAYEVWPEMLEAAIHAATAECASTDCSERFVPKTTGQRLQLYCSARCRNRERTRRYRATPKGAQVAREVRRRYYWSDPRIRERQAHDRAEERRKARERREVDTHESVDDMRRAS